MDLTKFDTARAAVRAGRKELDKASEAVRIARARKAEVVRLFKKDEDQVKVEFFSAGGIEVLIDWSGGGGSMAHDDPLGSESAKIVVTKRAALASGELTTLMTKSFSEQSPRGNKIWSAWKVLYETDDQIKRLREFVVLCAALCKENILTEKDKLISCCGLYFLEKEGHWCELSTE